MGLNPRCVPFYLVLALDALRARTLEFSCWYGLVRVQMLNGSRRSVTVRYPQTRARNMSA